MISNSIKFTDEYLTDKLTISGHKIEYVSYSSPYRINYKREYDIIKNKENNNSKREDNLARARKKVRQIIWSNLTPKTKFLTLTTKDTCLDVKEFRRHFTTFLQAMNRKGFDLRYLYVLERQKERGIKENNLGSIHAHCVIFNEEYIPLDILNKCWSYGNTDIKILNGLRQKDSEKINDVASYVCKYITKDSVAEWGQRTFNTSKNLYRPVEFNITAFYDGFSYVPSNDSIQKIALDLLNTSTFSYKNSKVIGGEDKGFMNIIDYSQGTW